MHLLQNTHVKGSSAPNNSSSNAILSSEDVCNLYVVEPPKYITARHIYTVLEKLGYDPTHASTIFHILCEAVNRMKTEKADSEDMGLDEADENGDNEDGDGKLSSSAPAQRAAPCHQVSMHQNKEHSSC
jgi:hypothetical protein